MLAGLAQGFRPDTQVPDTAYNIVFNEEGMGGFINYTGVTTWLAKHQPHLKGRIWCEQFLVPLLRDIHAPYPEWQVNPSDQFSRLAKLGEGTDTVGPSIAIGGKAEKRQFLTSVGAHPFDVGFAYWASQTPPPPDAYLPVLDYPDTQLPPNLRRLSGKYIVFTAGGTTPIRTMRGRDLNPLIKHVRALGLMPLFLGKRDKLGDGKSETTFADDTDYSEGIDLRDQTTVKAAACIMQHAACTVGLDGGLLHLAALMKDSRIVFGYNITSVAHRVPRRTHGKTVNVALTRDELSCTACQSTWVKVAKHRFDGCFYAAGRAGFDPSRPERSRACLNILFENDSERFKRAIDLAIN